jgi:hypothetical protein
MWYGGNESGRTTHWAIGDLIRYREGPTALMRVELVREMGDDGRGIACSIRYYGPAFHGGSNGAYHGHCHEPTEEDVERWKIAHDKNDQWIPGKW